MNLTALSTKKRDLDACRPLPKALVDNLSNWFRIELTYTSNAIEGNTLTRRETAMVVEHGITVGGKSLREHLEATNHSAAVEMISALSRRTPTSITEHDILTLHATILRGIDDINAGRYRSVPVRLAGSTVVLPNPRKVPDLMTAFVHWLRRTSKLHPVARAAEAHYRLVTIHPFVDGNGRTARLLMNLLLLMTGYPPALIRPQDRLAYIAALEQAQLGGARDAYDTLIARAVDRSLDMYLQAARGETPSPDAAPDTLLKIGALAKAVNESVPTIRYWTKEGLLHTADTTAAGYTLYTPDTIARVKTIQSLKAKRLTLTEIRERLGRPRR